MEARHNKATIISMAVLASAAATLFHEGLGHGLVAWLRGDIPTELTSNHLSTLKPDKWVEAAGTLVNLFSGAISFVLSLDRGLRANTRYFLWLFGAFSLLAGSGYFLFSGILGLGDWRAVIDGWPHTVLVRITMSILGAGLYLLAVRVLGIGVRPFCAKRGEYNAVGRLPYLAACVFECTAGALDPLGWRLLVMSTIPAAFGGSSGLLWADSLMPRSTNEPALTVSRARGWWVVAIVIGAAYLLIFGRGIRLAH